MGRQRSRLRVWLILALVTAAIWPLTCALYWRDIGPAYQRISSGSQIAQSRCGPIEYAAKGDGPPVLVVHGAGGGFDQGLELGEPLVRSGFRVIAMSRFGYLRTPLPADATAPAQADAHACLLDSLNIRQAVIVGVSAGGPSALQFALRFPHRTAALVLLVPAVYAPRPGHEPSLRTPRGTTFLLDTALRSDFLFWAAGKVAHDTFIRAILGTPPELVARASPEEQEHILPVSHRRAGLLNDAAVLSSLPRYELETIAAPTIAISTADDLYGTFEGARYTAEHVPHARFIGYPFGGHMLVERNADATSAVAAFLKGSARYDVPAVAPGPPPAWPP